MERILVIPLTLMMLLFLAPLSWGEGNLVQKQALLMAAQKTDQVLTSGPSAWLLQNQKPLLALYTTPEGRVYLYDEKGNYIGPVNAQEWQIFLLPVISKYHGMAEGGHGSGGCDSNGHKTPTAKKMI